MAPLTQNPAQFLTAFLTGTCPKALADGTGWIRHVCTLEGMTDLTVPYFAHLAFFTLFPIWEEVKNRICVTTNDLALKATGCPMELGAVAPAAVKRYPASLPARNPN